MKRILAVLSVLFVLGLPAHAADPALLDINIQAGEDYSLELFFADSAGAAINLTGYSYKSQCRLDYGQSAAFATFSTAVNPTAGKVTLRLSRAATAANVNKHGVYDVQQTDPSGNISYQVRGKVTVVPTVTK